ncbi:MAG TPA: hypothetical protein VGL66_15230 [Caulobacteraceae bacterium]|jgi:hypothetical protein
MNDERTIRPGMAPGLIVRSGPKATLAGSDVGVFVPLSALEPELRATPKTMVDLVSRLDRDAALLVCGIVNILVTGSGFTDVPERQRRAFSEVGTPEDGRTIDEWLRRQRPQGASAVVFFQGQILELVRWIALHAQPGTGDTTCFADPEQRKTFLRAALVASELWSARTIGDRLSGGKTNAEAVERALGAFRKSTEESGVATHIGVAIARGRLLFQRYLPARLPTFRDEFRAATGITIEDYLTCVTMLMPKASDVPSDGAMFRPTYAAATEFAAEFALFLSQVSQTPDELKVSLESGFAKNGFKSLREKPILTTPSGLSVILDPAYFVDHFTLSPLFRVIALGRQTNAVFGAFGHAFEDYAIEILGRRYPPVFGVKRLFTRVKSSEDNPEFEIDALLNEGADLVLMEMKAVFVPERSILTDDHGDFLKELRKKYAVEPGEQDREVGVAQLAKQVRAIVLGRWAGAEIDHGQLRQVFPVLVVYDERLASPGVGAFLNERFRDALGDVARKDVVIRDLAIMTIHDLETKESTDGFSLTELLSAYLPESRGGMVSLHNFVARHPTFNTMLRPNETLMATSLAEIEELQKRLFPKLAGDGQ